MTLEAKESIIRKINRNYEMPQCDYWILDTDAGADDAQAIIAMIYLAKKNKKTILGITAVNGNGYVQDVVKNILITLAVSETKIPVYKGAGMSFLGEDLKDHFFGKDAFGEKQKSYLDDFKQKIDYSLNKTQPASLFIVETAEKYAGNIGIIALGPLTNLAMAYMLDPQVASNVNMVTMMGGNYSSFGMNDYFGCEFNFRLDPQAARIVIKRFKNIFCTTIQVPFDFPQGICERVFKKETTPKAKLIKDLYENIYQDFGGAFVCDPLAVFAALSPKQALLGLYQAQGTVYIRGSRTRGMLCMNWLGAQGKGLNICLQWNMKYVLEEIEESYKVKYDFQQ